MNCYNITGLCEPEEKCTCYGDVTPEEIFTEVDLILIKRLVETVPESTPKARVRNTIAYLLERNRYKNEQA